MRGLSLLILLIFGFTSIAYAPIESKNYFYYLGPWIWDDKEDGFWKSPEGTIGLIDLRTIPQMSIAGGTPQGQGFFATTKELDGKYELLFKGDISSPEGKETLDLLWDKLTVNSDPEGLTAPKPLIPTADLKLELYLGGHSLIKTEAFVYGVHPHTSKVQAILQEDYRKIRQESIAAEKNTYLKVLDMMGEKYKVARPQDEFIPADLPKETPIPHETTLTDNFDRTDADALGTSSQGTWSWTEYEGDIDIVSNTGVQQSTSAADGAWANLALSSNDNYAQGAFYMGTYSSVGQQAGGTFARGNNNASPTAYHGRVVHTNNGTTGVQLYKFVSGTGTLLSELSFGIYAANTYTVKTEANGTAIKVYVDTVEKIGVTDSAVSSGTYAGIRFRPVNKVNPTTIDNFEAGDLGAAGIKKGLVMIVN